MDFPNNPMEGALRGSLGVTKVVLSWGSYLYLITVWVGTRGWHTGLALDQFWTGLIPAC